MENADVARAPYVVPRYRDGGDPAWYHVLHGTVPGHQIDFMYAPEVPQGRLTQTHFGHLARLMKYIEPREGAPYAFALGNLSRDDVQHEPGHGGLALIFALRVAGVTDHAGRAMPPYAHGVLAIDRAFDHPTLLEAIGVFYRRFLEGDAQAEAATGSFYRAYVRAMREQPETVPRFLHDYVSGFGELPQPRPSALGWDWEADESALPKRVTIVHADDEPFANVANAAALLGAMLYRSNIKWTTISSDRGIEIAGGMSIRFVPASEAPRDGQGQGLVLPLRDLPEQEEALASQIFGARSRHVEAKVARPGWRKALGMPKVDGAPAAGAGRGTAGASPVGVAVPAVSPAAVGHVVATPAVVAGPVVASPAVVASQAAVAVPVVASPAVVASQAAVAVPVVASPAVVASQAAVTSPAVVETSTAMMASPAVAAGRLAASLAVAETGTLVVRPEADGARRGDSPSDDPPPSSPVPVDVNDFDSAPTQRAALEEDPAASAPESRRSASPAMAPVHEQAWSPPSDGVTVALKPPLSPPTAAAVTVAAKEAAPAEATAAAIAGVGVAARVAAPAGVAAAARVAAPAGVAAAAKVAAPPPAGQVSVAPSSSRGTRPVLQSDATEAGAEGTDFSQPRSRVGLWVGLLVGGIGVIAAILYAVAGGGGDKGGGEAPSGSTTAVAPPVTAKSVSTSSTEPPSSATPAPTSTVQAAPPRSTATPVAPSPGGSPPVTTASPPVTAADSPTGAAGAAAPPTSTAMPTPPRPPGTSTKPGKGGLKGDLRGL